MIHAIEEKMPKVLRAIFYKGISRCTFKLSIGTQFGGIFQYFEVQLSQLTLHEVQTFRGTLQKCWQSEGAIFYCVPLQTASQTSLTQTICSHPSSVQARNLNYWAKGFNVKVHHMYIIYGAICVLDKINFVIQKFQHLCSDEWACLDDS